LPYIYLLTASTGKKQLSAKL